MDQLQFPFVNVYFQEIIIIIMGKYPESFSAELEGSEKYSKCSYI